MLIASSWTDEEHTTWSALARVERSDLDPNGTWTDKELCDEAEWLTDWHYHYIGPSRGFAGHPSAFVTKFSVWVRQSGGLDV